MSTQPTAPEPPENWTEQQMLAATAEIDAPGHYTFKRGVKAITQETKWDRALPIFRRFLRSMLDTDEQLYAHLKHAEEHGFRSVRVGIWTDDFAAWKIGHKSEQAKASRAAGVKKQQSKRAKRPLPRKKK